MNADSLARVLAEHDAPQHCCKRKAHDGLKPIAALVADMQKQMIEYQAALADEVLTDDSAEGNIEHFHQTIGAGEREIAALALAARNVAKVFSQLDRYVADRRREIAAAAVAVPAEPVAAENTSDVEGVQA